MKKLPWVVRPIGAEIMAGEPIQSNQKLRARVTRTLLEADRVVAQSRELESLYIELGVAPESIERIPNGVDLRIEVSRSENEPRVAAMGILHPKKGFDLLIEAFAKIRARHPAAKLAIAGDGPERERLQQLVERSGLTESVEFAGMLDGAQKQRFLDRAQLFVSVSRRESFSNANLEALAAGLPMVVTAVGGNREIVESGKNGLLVPPEDPKALADAISHLLAEPQLRGRMAAASRTKAAEYSWEKITDRYEALYAEIAGTSLGGG